MERVPDLGAHTRLEHLQCFTHTSKFCIWQRSALGTFHGDVPVRRFTVILFTLFHAPIAGIGQHDGLVTARPSMCLRDIGDVASLADERMD